MTFAEQKPKVVLKKPSSCSQVYALNLTPAPLSTAGWEQHPFKGWQMGVAF